MKKVIDGTMYNTETAKVAEWRNSRSYDDILFEDDGCLENA